MTKTYCDKCGKDISDREYPDWEDQLNNIGEGNVMVEYVHRVFRKQNGELGRTSIEFCEECEKQVAQIVKDFIDGNG